MKVKPKRKKTSAGAVKSVLSLKPDPANPNRMDAEDKARMAKSLAEFGDLSGVILNRRTGLLIGGHQRADVLAGADIQTEELSKPDPDGTVARGWLVHLGRRYAVRVVDWSENKAHMALLAANRYGRVETTAGMVINLATNVYSAMSFGQRDNWLSLAGGSNTVSVTVGSGGSGNNTANATILFEYSDSYA
jgi:hypothetical protein